MSSVPWIRLYVSWPRHRKTMALRRLIGTAEPILSLWCWAAENAPDGNLTDLSDAEVEQAADWRGECGRAVSAMVEAGFLVRANTGLALHEWLDHAGAGIAQLTKTREYQRDLMRERRAQAKGALQESLNARASDPEDLGSKIRESKSKSDLPHAIPNVRTNCKPPTRVVLDRFGAIRAEVCGTKAIFWQASEPALAKGAAWLDAMDAEAVPDIEPAIRLACQHVHQGADGWTGRAMADPNFLWGAILAKWSALREELHGAAPAVKERPSKPGQPAPVVSYGPLAGGNR